MSELKRIAENKKLDMGDLCEVLIDQLGQEKVVDIIENYLRDEGELDDVIEEINENY